MAVKFKKKSQIIDILITAVAAVLSVGTMLYGIFHFGVTGVWAELVLNVFYISCLVMMGMYFFDKISTQRFNYWTSVCLGCTVILRDIIFLPPMAIYPLHLACLILSVLLLILLTFFYSRKDWKSYSKRNLWILFIIDMLIAVFYNIDICLEPANEFTDYLLVEIWIRPTLTYGLVACFTVETESKTTKQD